MEECKSNQKKIVPNQNNSNTNLGVDLSSISSVLDKILCVFNSSKSAIQQLPPPLLLIGKNFRPGMSARNLAGRTIAKLESDAKIPMGDIFADGANSEATKMKIISEELVNMIQTEARVDVLIDPGAIQITAAGASPSGPVTVQGTNTIFASGGGGVC